MTMWRILFARLALFYLALQFRISTCSLCCYIDIAIPHVPQGADVNRMHGTLKPLHCACMVADADCVELLLEKGAEVSSTSKFPCDAKFTLTVFYNKLGVTVLSVNSPEIIHISVLFFHSFYFRESLCQNTQFWKSAFCDLVIHLPWHGQSPHPDVALWTLCFCLFPNMWKIKTKPDNINR